MNIKFFKDLSKDSVDIAGGKGASLGEMTQAGIPVPPGFVVLSESFERFLKETDLNVEIDSILHSVNQNEMHTVENASEKIQSLIKSADMPEDIAKEVESAFKELGAEYVAVRSSATAEDSASAAWAGQLDSYLNTTEENLLKRVQDCWASLFTPRAIFYRIEKDLHNTKVSVAVVVQKMVDAEKSGIAFSVHPVTEDYNQLIVEAGFGLGEAIVSGQITPDSYVVEKDPRRIVDININTQNKALYKGKKGGNEWKDLSENEGGKQVLSKEEVMELSKLILKIEDHYGFPCDIEWAYEDGKFYIVQSRPITTLKENKNTKTDNEKKVISDSNLENYLNSKWHHNGSWKQNVLSASFWVSAQGTSYFKLILGDQNIHFINYDSNFWYLDKLNNSVIKKIKRIIKNDSFDDYFKNLIDISNSISNQYEKLFKNRKYDEKTLSELFSIQKELYGFWLAIDIIGENILQIALRAGWTKSEKDLLDKVQPHLFKTWIEKENNLLIDLANSNKSIDEKRKKYRDDYFWQGLYKWQGQTLSDSDIDEKIDNAKNGIKSKFKDYNINLLSDYDPLMKLSILSSYWRTQCSELATIFEFYVKDIVTDKVNKEINIINLTCDEIVDNNFSEPKDNFKSRSKGVFQYLNNNNEVITIPVMDENYSHIFKRFIKAKEDLNIITSQNIIKGTPVSKGSVQGTAKIILSKEDFNKFEQGNILVTTETTPVFVPLMKMSSAILTERGGVTSHAAIVSRELGVPCVISLKNITEHIQDGDKIEVDADKGIVKIIKKEQINQEKVFERFTSRPYSMIHIEAYNEALEQAKNELGHRVYPVFKYDSQKHLVEVFFEMNELHILFEHLGKKAEDQLFLDGVIKDFNESREKLEEIFQKAKVGEISLDQIDDVYRLFVRFFKGLMYVWVIPRLENIPQNVRDKVLEVRRETEHLSAQRDKLFPIILNSIYPKLEDNAYFVSCEHLERYESEDDLVNQAKKYADGFVYYQDDLVLQDDISDFLKKKEIDLSSSITSSADDKITGDIACQGKVQGIVRLIYTDKDLGKVSSSKDIIVSPMTRPDFLPAMKKASAFVTDEGGVTCHAAIVAREMKKPCIIGTKFATEVLKDGDEIEVDANKGIVKIVNKNIKKYKINNQEIFLEKQHTRDLSLLKLSTWMYFDLHGLKEEIGVEIKNTVFYFNGEYVKVYYHMPSLNEVFNAITILCKDQNKIDSIFVRIKDLFNKIYPYLNRDKEIKSFKDLEYFYKTYKSYWKLLALIFVIPNLPDISQKIKNNSLKFREKVQSYPADSIFIDGLSQVFPKLSKKEIKVLSKNEIFGNKEIYKQELKKRLQGYIYYEDNLYVGDEMDDLIKEKNFIFNDEVFDSSNVDSLKGVVGFSGKVKGKCKVCMTANEINKVKEGDIIVSPMTTPDFLPAMKKALAFVTDEGGVTCHAAIVAREMKKPCIIGTKFATEVLKDGDEIEVDANKGIVKIINKNNE